MSIKEVIAKARKEGRKVLTETEAKDALQKAGINVIETKLAATKEEAVTISKQMGLPVALKIVSPDVIHKSDSGGVKLDLKTTGQVEEAYDDIIKNIKKQFPQANVHGVSVQKMARPGVEVIVGVSTDAQFGPVVMFGLGGILVEILKDVSFRIVPLEKKDAREMIREIKGYPVLEGYRGQEAVDIANLEEMILKVSDFVEKNPGVEELDLNPVFAYGDGAVAVDARIILGEGK
ncbi:acetate--CoA ligase family protein [Chloroflexota bacterium]